MTLTAMLGFSLIMALLGLIISAVALYLWVTKS